MNADLIEFKTQIDLAVVNQPVVVQTQEDYTHWSDVMKLCKNKIKEVDEERKSYTDPLEKSKKLLIAKAKQIIEPLEQYVDKISNAMGAYYLEEEKKRQAEQKRLEEEAIKKANEEAERIAKENKTEVVVPCDIVVPVVESIKTTRGEIGTTTGIKYNDFIIIDENLIPREYLIVNESAIREAINKGGVKEIAGIKIQEKVRFTNR